MNLNMKHVRSSLGIGLVWVLAAILATLIGIACAGGDADGDATESGAAAVADADAHSDDATDAHSASGDGHDAEEHDSAADAHSESVEVTVHASDLLKFEPPEIRVNAGQRVRLVLDNEQGSVLHDFTIEQMAVDDVHVEGAAHAHNEDMHYALHVATEPGEAGVVEFTPTEPGTYEFFCTVPGHAQAGMVGTLIVEG